MGDGAPNSRARRGSLAGQLIAGHELVRVLAAGGMGEVYLARHQALGVLRAIKVIRSDMREYDDTHGRFTREAQVLARLQHNAIVQIIDFGASSTGRPFLVMEYIDGPNLDQVIESSGPLPLPQALIVLEQIAAALDYAHKQGVTHRDLKPANVLLRAGDHRQVTVIDFGLAHTRAAEGEMRLTAEGQMVGSPLYMAPEQADGRPDVTAAADVYALAGVAYTVLSGHSPFQGLSLLQLIYAHAEKIPPRLSERCPGLPRFLDELLFSCLAKEPSARPHTDEVAGHLARLARGAQAVPASPPAIVAVHASVTKSASAIAALLDHPPPDDQSGVTSALINQVLAIINELAASLSMRDREIVGQLREMDRLKAVLTDCEMDAALLDAQLGEAGSSERGAIAAAKRAVDARVVALHGELTEIQRQLVVCVERKRPHADGTTSKLFAEIDQALAELGRMSGSAS